MSCQHLKRWPSLRWYVPLVVTLTFLAQVWEMTR